MAITEDDLARIKAEHPADELHLLSNTDTGVEVVVKTPNEGEWKRFRTAQADDNQKPIALRLLLLGCIVEPKPADFTAILGHRPGLVETFAAELIEIAGVSRATTRRKL